MQKANCKQRVLKDYVKYQKSGAQMNIICSPDANDMMKWEAVILGPEDTDWQGGIFKLMITFGNDYPTAPPKVRFLTKMFHPNIYLNGEICLDILQNNWTPTYTAVEALLSIQSLLDDPNCKSPANPEAS